jgi:hypothetical protein
MVLEVCILTATPLQFLVHDRVVTVVIHSWRVENFVQSIKQVSSRILGAGVPRLLRFQEKALTVRTQQTLARTEAQSLRTQEPTTQAQGNTMREARTVE